jgi:hypothetical protein
VSFRAALASLVVTAILMIALGIRIALSGAHRNSEKRERRRRLLVHQYGRLGDALITGFTGTLLYYTYSVSGVQYHASQDMAAFRGKLPEDLRRVLGVAGLKYLGQNPANSILICEEWSGLRESAMDLEHA